MVSCAARRWGSGTASTSASTEESPKSAEDAARQLSKDYQRAGSRAYSEEGIPVFLVGENLVPDGTGSGDGGAAADPERARLVATFRRYAEALPTVRSEVVPGDVGKLIEVLADRDFGV